MKHPFPRLRTACLTLGLGGGCLSGQTTDIPVSHQPPATVTSANDHGDRGPLIVVSPVAPPTLMPAPPHALGPGQGVFAPAHSATDAPPPLSGGTLLALRDGRTAVAADPDRDRLWVVDVVEERALAEIPLSPGDEPGRLTEDGAGRVHVVLRRGGALVSFTPGAGAPSIERRPVCSAPRGLAYQASTQQIHVACAGGELVSLPAGGGPATRTRNLEEDLRDVVVEQERLLVTRFRRAEILVLGADGGIEERLRPAEALNLARRHSVSRPARTRYLPSVAWRAVARPGGGVYLAHQRAFNGEVGALSGGGSYGGFNCDTIVQSVVSSLIPGSTADRAPEPAPVLNGVVLPVDLALSPDGRRLALLAAGEPRFMGESSRVVVGSATAFASSPPTNGECVHPGSLDPAGFTGSDVDRWSPDPPEGLASSHIAGQGVAIAFDTRGEVLVQTRAPATLRVPRLGKVIALGAGQQRDTGYTVFHAATQGNMACASCHPDALEDGQVWTFVGLGPRRTQFLRVGLGQTAPFHWDGSLATLGDLMKEVFSGRMTGALLDDGQVAALGSWLDRLPVPSGRRAAGDAAAMRGKAIFESPAVGCAHCHKGPRLTDNLTHDVGTGAKLQTPSLVGLSWHTPLMHDGCASNLLGRFAGDCGGGDRHGVISRLSAVELTDLVAYLESL